MSEETLSTPVKTGDGAPGPSYHPDAVRQDFNGIDHPLAKKALAAAHDALSVSYSVHGNIDSTEKALAALASPDAPTYRGANGTLVRETGSEAELAKAAEKATERALATISRRVAEVESTRVALQSAIDQSMRFEGAGNPHGIAVGTAIRNHVASLTKDGERTAFMMAAIKNHDVQTLDAVLDRVPPYLSGLSAADAQMFRNHAAKSLAPTESRLLESVDKALDRMRKGASSLVARTALVTAAANDRAARRAEALAKLTGAK